MNQKSTKAICLAVVLIDLVRGVKAITDQGYYDWVRGLGFFDACQPMLEEFAPRLEFKHKTVSTDPYGR